MINRWVRGSYPPEWKEPDQRMSKPVKSRVVPAEANLLQARGGGGGGGWNRLSDSWEAAEYWRLSESVRPWIAYHVRLRKDRTWTYSNEATPLKHHVSRLQGKDLKDRPREVDGYTLHVNIQFSWGMNSWISLTHGRVQHANRIRCSWSNLGVPRMGWYPRMQHSWDNSTNGVPIFHLK